MYEILLNGTSLVWAWHREGSLDFASMKTGSIYIQCAQPVPVHYKCGNIHVLNLVFNRVCFNNPATKKSLELAERYKELKKSGKVENYMAKKRKKNA